METTANTKIISIYWSQSKQMVKLTDIRVGENARSNLKWATIRQQSKCHVHTFTTTIFGCLVFKWGKGLIHSQPCPILVTFQARPATQVAYNFGLIREMWSFNYFHEIVQFGIFACMIVRKYIAITIKEIHNHQVIPLKKV